MARWTELRQRLVRAARQASGRAYCPYSGFRVGAALLTRRGNLFLGCNVENASYGLTVCAERNAVFRAVATEGPTMRIRALAVYTPTPHPSPPCGACRQVIQEFGPDARIISSCDGPAVLSRRLDQLLPEAFGLPARGSTPSPAGGPAVQGRPGRSTTSALPAGKARRTKRSGP